MLKRDQRIYLILELHKKGHGTRMIQQALKISRPTILKVLRSQSPEQPKVVRIDNTHVVLASDLKNPPRRR